MPKLIASAHLKALAGAKEGIQRLQDRGVPWLRPPDYYAEMVKSDGHMSSIKQRLVYEQKQIEESEERSAPYSNVILVVAPGLPSLGPDIASNISCEDILSS